MKRLGGPELKMPELKVPGFLADLYHDLRDRRLLPLVALVLVAIVATPILLGQKSETTLPPAGAGPIAAPEAGGKTAELTVVEANPGLRDYRKRLRGREPLDPFRRSSGASGSTGGGSSAATTSESSTSVSVTSESGPSTGASAETSPETGGAPSGSPANEGGGDGGGSGGGGGEKGGGGNGGDQSGGPHATLYSFAVDLTIVHSSGSAAGGDRKTSEPETRKRVLPTTSLPGEKKQVVTYMGLSPKTRKPLFLVSSDVTGVFGEGKCAAGMGACQLVELEPGFPEVFEYGEGGDRYKITITNVELVVTGHV